jgi:hypothetical protein
VSLPRPVVHVLMLVAIAAGIWLGTQAFTFFAGG